MLHLTKLRNLTLRAPPQPGRPSHLSAASGLVRAGEFLYVVADDELHLGVFPATGDAPGALVRIFGGELPAATAARKAAKPDLEALALLPPGPAFPSGALLALGSGSTPWRRSGVLLVLDDQGFVAAEPRLLDFTGLVAALGRALGGVNIEGAVVTPGGDRLVLLQRGHRGGARNALVQVDLAAALQSADSADFRVEIRDVDLGGVDGVPLCFTDGAPLDDGSIVFSAIAEDTQSSYADGPCVSAAVGVVGLDGRVRQLEALAEAAKVEGVAARARGPMLELVMVTDADDASVPATLCTVELQYHG